MQNLDNGKALSFKGFVTESETTDHLKLIKMGIGSTMVMIEARVNWRNLEDPQSAYDAHWNAFLNWTLYRQWPTGRGRESWYEHAEEVPFLLNTRGNEDTKEEIVNSHLFLVAEENGADILHIIFDTATSSDEVWIDVATGEEINSPDMPVSENSSRDYKLLNSMGLATPAGLQVDEIEPEAKDIERAQTMSNIWGNDDQTGAAAKMAKLITDPVKMVRRAKAVAQACRNTDVHHQFAHQMIVMGFDIAQVKAIFGDGVRTHAPRDHGRARQGPIRRGRR